MTNATRIPDLILNDGRAMPQIGYGVWKIDDHDAERLVAEALNAGYRSIDTAMIYANERGTGAAIRASGVPREDIFVTTKLWNTDQGYDATLRAFDTSLQLLGLDYVDLYLIHWPVAAQDLYVESWRALIELRDRGLARSIGVSNFQPDHLRRLVAETAVVPSVNQVELHPYLQQIELQAVHAELGVVTEAWSPLAKGGDLLVDPVVQKIAGELGVSAAQAVLRWHIQVGNIVIPKSATPARIAQNLDLLNFELSDAQMLAMAALNRDQRVGPHPDQMN